MIGTGNADVLGVDPGRVGGITGALRIIRLVEDAGVWFNAHAWSGAPVTAASLALSFTTNRCLLFEFKPIENPKQHELVTNPFVHDRGTVGIPPERPGWASTCRRASSRSTSCDHRSLRESLRDRETPVPLTVGAVGVEEVGEGVAQEGEDQHRYEYGASRSQRQVGIGGDQGLSGEEHGAPGRGGRLGAQTQETEAASVSTAVAKVRVNCTMMIEVRLGRSDRCIR